MPHHWLRFTRSLDSGSTMLSCNVNTATRQVLPHEASPSSTPRLHVAIEPGPCRNTLNCTQITPSNNDTAATFCLHPVVCPDQVPSLDQIISSPSLLNTSPSHLVVYPNQVPFLDRPLSTRSNTFLPHRVVYLSGSGYLTVDINLLHEAVSFAHTALLHQAAYPLQVPFLGQIILP